MQIHLTDDQALALRLLAIRLGLPAEEIARYAVGDFLARHSGG
jgi:hypothetical protein